MEKILLLAGVLALAGTAFYMLHHRDLDNNNSGIPSQVVDAFRDWKK